MLSLIVAIAENGVIGKDNRLIWKIPKDLQYFKNRTMGKKILMGRKTFESFSGLLPGRQHIVLTRDVNYKAPKEVTVLHHIHKVDQYINSEEEVFLIGGGELYDKLIDRCNRLYITWVHQKFDGDTIFPVEKVKSFQEVSKVDDFDEMSGLKITFSIYEKNEGDY